MFDHVKIGVSDFEASKAFFFRHSGIGPDEHTIEAVCHA